MDVKASRYPSGRSRRGKDMNRRPGGDASLNGPIRNDGEAGEWQDWLAEDTASQETTLAEGEESDNRHKALVGALTVLNERGRHIFEARRLADDPSRRKNLPGRATIELHQLRS